MKPYFSIIIPCLNEEHFLPKLLKNLNSQTFTDFEVIIVDGNSTDKTVEVATKFKSKFPLHITSTKVKGVSYARNFGAKKSIGEILIFFDADSQIPKNYLKKIHEAFNDKKPDFLTTYINVDSIRPSEKVFASSSNLVFEIGRVLKVPLSYGAMQAVRREAFFKVNGYDVKTKFAEDSQLFQKLYENKYKFIVLKNPRYTFSLRRFRSEGTLKSLIQYIRLNTNIFLNGYHISPKVNYQMGGAKYDLQKIENANYSQVFKLAFDRINKIIKKQNIKSRQTFKKIFSLK